MITPPPSIERLLTSLGAEPRYREAVLGDLAEEFAIRVEEQGVRVARRWYRREALRTAPHLLASWLRHLTAPDVVRLCVAVTVGGVAHLLLSLAIPAAIVMSLGVRPDSFGIIAAAWRDVLSETVVLKWTGILLLRALPLVAGFIAASVNPRARVPAALTLMVIDSVMIGYDYAVATHSAPHPIAVALMLLLSLAMIVLGGALRALIDANAREVVEAPSTS